MSVSGSYDFSLNRDELIKDSLIDAQVIDEAETPSASMIEYSQRSLNRMLKAWQADGLQLWVHRETTLFLEKNKSKYQFSVDNVTESFTETAIKTAAATSATSIDVDSTTGMAASDFIGIELDDGTMHWTTVSSVTDSDTVVIASGLASAATVDKVVYFYTTKIPSPLKITSAHLRQYGTNITTSFIDIPMTIIARKDYWDLGSKDPDGTPNLIYFDPQLAQSEVRIYNEPDNVKNVIKLICQFPFDDMDSASDDLSFPDYWFDAVHYGMADRLAASYRAPEDIRLEMRIRARQAKKHALDFDVEIAPLFLEPDTQYLEGY